MTYRLRQICLVAEDLEATLAALSQSLNAEICYRDPDVKLFGLANGLFALNSDFLEVISPIEENTAGGRHLARYGDSGYMIILECENAAPVREHIIAQGVRAIWTIDNHSELPGVIATHFHPRDVGGAILSIDSMGGETDWQSPHSKWIWAGTDWHQKISTSTKGFRNARLTSPQPERLAQKWSALLNIEVQEKAGAFHLPLINAELIFEKGETEQLCGFSCHAGDIDKMQTHICGVDINID